ncbi:VOC family protein [Heyndrickxia sporothermodurans]
MKLSFDHLVHIVNRPEDAIEDFAAIGLKASLGGRHENWGTYNALSYFDLCYIEFLGIFDREKAEKMKENDLVVQTMKLLPHFEGFSRIALRTNNINEISNLLQSNGIKIKGPIKGERKRDDGKMLHWKMLFINEKIGGIPFPFIIQWNIEDDIRREDIESMNNHRQLNELVFAVENYEKAAARWSEVFQLKMRKSYKDKKLKANCILLELNGCNLVFASPYSKGEISRIIETKGEGPFLLKISNNNIVLEKEMFGGYYQFV